MKKNRTKTSKYVQTYFYSSAFYSHSYFHLSNLSKLQVLHIYVHFTDSLERSIKEKSWYKIRKPFSSLKKERKKEKARKELRFTYIKLRSLSTLSSVSCPRNVWPSSRRNTWTSFHCRTQRPWKLGNLWSPTCHPPANTRDILNRGWRHLLTGKIDECSQVVIRKPCFLFPQFVLEKSRE